MKRHVLFLPHMQTVKRRLYRFSWDLVATGAEWTLHYLHARAQTHVHINKERWGREGELSIRTVDYAMAAPSETCIFFYQYRSGIYLVCSNLTLCTMSAVLCVLHCVDRGPHGVRSRFQGALPNVYKQDFETRRTGFLGLALVCSASKRERWTVIYVAANMCVKRKHRRVSVICKMLLILYKRLLMLACYE
jgi:hypothetical protein